METIFLKESEYEQWDDFVDRSPQGSLFAKSFYLQALEVKFRILCAANEQGIQGGIVLTSDKWSYNINPVLCKYLGILFRDFDGADYTVETKRREVQQVLLKILTSQSSFEYTFHPNYTSWLPFHNAGFQQSSRVTYRIDLNSFTDEGELLSRMHSRLRNKITKAQRESKCQIALSDHSNAAIAILQSTYEKQNIRMPIPGKQLNHLLTILQAYDALEFLEAKDESGNTLAVLGLFYDKHTAYLMLNGIKPDMEERGLNETLIYEGILWARAHGLKYFDFEGSMLPSIESFYRQFGGEMVTYDLIYKNGWVRRLRRLKQLFF